MKPLKIIIHDRRFWFVYPDGKMERIVANDRIKAHLSQVRSGDPRFDTDKAKRTTNPPRPPGTAPTLPAADRNIGNMTLIELAQAHGWGSIRRFTEELRKHRPAIYQQARDNGIDRRHANLMVPPKFGERA
jgi:hypothetical protein